MLRILILQISGQPDIRPAGYPSYIKTDTGYPLRPAISKDLIINVFSLKTGEIFEAKN
jgi:hypothetical protein